MFVQKVFAIQTEIDISMMFGDKKKFNIMVPRWYVADYILVRSVMVALQFLRYNRILIMSVGLVQNYPPCPWNRIHCVHAVVRHCAFL